MAYLPWPEFWDLAESRPARFCAGQASPPSWTKPARPQASLRPGIRPRQKRLGRILGLGPGVEQFSATCKACSTQAETSGSRRNLPWQKSARPPGRASWTPTASSCLKGISRVPWEFPGGLHSPRFPMPRRISHGIQVWVEAISITD